MKMKVKKIKSQFRSILEKQKAEAKEKTFLIALSELGLNIKYQMKI